MTLEQRRIFNRSKRQFFLGLAVLFVTLLIVPIFTLIYFSNDVKSKSRIMTKKDQGIVLYDRNDKPFFTFYQGKTKNYVTLNEVPDFIEQAIISIEDKNFYSHNGYSISSIARSFFKNVRNQDMSYGGSTITQQLVKNTLLNPRKDLLRKYQELILSIELEDRYTKEELLEMYINTSYWGEGATGLAAAANAYFAKDVNDLSLAEASMLAGVLPAPSRINPVSGDQEAARYRQEQVLKNMVEERYITQEEADHALTQELVYKDGDGDLNKIAPHFALMVRDELVNEYGEEYLSTSGLKIKTTLDLDMQSFAEKTVLSGVDNLRRNRVSNGAAAAMDPKTGEILALVGSKSWHEEGYGKFNVAIAPRQPGSSFKPIVYARALEKKVITPATILKDEPITYDVKPLPYSPKNYDGKFRGKVLTREALANSLNVPAVEVMNQVGVTDAIDMAQRMGIDTLNDPSRFGLSLVLGSGEVTLLDMVEAYGVFANSGYKNKPQIILEIKDKYEQSLYSYSANPEKILDAEYAYLISSILSDKKARQGTFGNKLDLTKHNAAVKTGTTQNYKDGWTIGYTPQLVVGVWVGNNDGRQMDNVAGSLGAAPLWRNLMNQFLVDKQVLAFEQPVGVLSLAVCKSNGLLTTAETQGNSYTEYFARGTEPTSHCPTPPPPPEDLAQNPNQQPQEGQTQPIAIAADMPVGGPPEDKKEEKRN